MLNLFSLIMKISVNESMDKNKSPKYGHGHLTLFAAAGFIFLLSCNQIPQPAEKEMVSMPEQIDPIVKNQIAISLEYIAAHQGKLNDSLEFRNDSVLSGIYQQKAFQPCWSSASRWLPQGEKLLKFIEQAALYGLFPGDYHFNQLKKIRAIFETDSLIKNERLDAALWARADLMLSDALVSMFRDIKLGRLPSDSITMRKDSVLDKELIEEKFNAAVSGISLDSIAASLEPRHKGYHELKAAVRNFLKEAHFKTISAITYPNKNQSELKSSIIKRLVEEGYADSAFSPDDSLRLATVLKKYQKDKNITADGKIGSQTVRMLNLSDLEKFYRIAITMDRYKLLPEEMPATYIWVNIPSFSFSIFHKGTAVVTSRVVVGKPQTRTPVLNSFVSEIITYPQWNIPQSIIVKEILPALKKNPGYLAKKGFSLFDRNGEEVDPYTVNWAKYQKGIPYRIVQGSGDDNALGVLKFNFPNKYSVYLHDTNQRSYFGLDNRAQSHGCIRLQEWEKTALFILKLENEYAQQNNKKTVSPEQLKSWLSLKEKHNIPLHVKIPVFIRYFTCEALDGKITFYEDIYDEDKKLALKYFTAKIPVL